MRFASIIFDFDSTIVDCETLDLLSEVALEGRSDKETIVKEVKHITNLGMEGRVPFGESLARRMALIAPDRTAVETVTARMVERITPSFLAHRDFFTSHHDAIYVISGGFDEVIIPVADMLGIDRTHIFANTFVYDDNGIVVGVDQTRPSAQTGGKARAVEEARLPRPSVIVGDGWTDYEIKQKGVADVFICYAEHARREKVVLNADAVAMSFDDLLRSCEA